MLSYVFAGQGSQRRGMGAELFRQYPRLTRAADEILGYGIEQLCLEGPASRLAQTQYTQPALYVVGALSYMARREQGSRAPDFLAGHSLGEYNALLAANAFDFATGLQLVKKRGELMGEARGGAMAAVLGLSEDAGRRVLTEQGLEAVDVANLNTPDQIVVSGLEADVEHAGAAFARAGARVVPLNVSAAFHSRQMQPAADAFAQFIGRFTLRDPELPVIANATARPYERGAVAANLVAQLRSPVRWCDSVRFLLRRDPAMTFEELSPTAVVSRMIEQIRQQPLPASTPEPPVPAPAAETDDRLHSVIALEDRQRSARVSGRDDRGVAPAERLGSAAFRREYGVRLAYASGSMYRGIASEDLVVRMGKARLLAFFGTGGLSPERIERSIEQIRAQLPRGAQFGMNLLASGHERQLVELYLKQRVDLVEASAYVQLTPALVKYRVQGLQQRPDGTLVAKNRILAKVSRPEVAEHFLRPAPERILRRLCEANELSEAQAQLAARVPMCDDLCVEADSGGHTDGGVAAVLLPAMRRLRDSIVADHGFVARVRVGAAGGIGTPEAVVASLVLGADFVLTGSINQCTAEAGHSQAVKDLLERINIQDTAYAPAGDMFEMGARVQVLKRGVLFAPRANRLYELYRQYESLEEIPAATRAQLEEKYFKRSFSQVFEELRRSRPALEIARAERESKYKMRLVFKWYFGHTNRLAFRGNREDQVDFQVHCGPALGAFNQWVKGTSLESWRERHVDEIAERLMSEAAALVATILQPHVATGDASRGADPEPCRRDPTDAAWRRARAAGA